MNKKILPLLIGALLSVGANANSTYMSVINRFEKEGGFVSAPVAKLSYLYLEETDQDTVFNLPITFSNGKPTNGSVDYTIIHLTTTDDDIILDSGTLTIGVGHSNTVPVTIKGDYILESDEVFRVTISNAKLMTIPLGDEIYDYTIVDNDTVPTISIEDLTIAEGDSDITANVIVSLSKPSGTAFTVDFTTEVGTATTADLENVSGTLSFDVGESQKTIPIVIKGDTLDEFDETFKVKLSNSTFVTIDDGESVVTIEDNDLAPSLSLKDRVFIEGDELENKEAVITLSKVSAKDIEIDFTTEVTGSATAEDFVVESGTVTVLAGELIGIIPVQSYGDYTMENDETFGLSISNPVNAIISKNTAVLTLSNDDSQYEFNTLPLYGKIEYKNKDTDNWEDVIENYGYERDIQFRHNPTESEVLAVSRDINIGSFDTDPSTPYYTEGSHSLSDWGTTTSNKATFNESGVTITTELLNGDFNFRTDPGTHLGVGIGSTATSGHLMNGEEVIIKLTGDFLNDVRIAADGLGSCYDYGSGCETKVEIEAYDFDDNSIDIQGGYRQPTTGEYGEAWVDNYYFTGETAISKFVVRTIPTNNGGNNSSLSSGSNTLLNMTVSRSAFEVIDYKYTDIDGTISTETINLNINEGNANTNVDLNQYLLGQ